MSRNDLICHAKAEPLGVAPSQFSVVLPVRTKSPTRSLITRFSTAAPLPTVESSAAESGTATKPLPVLSLIPVSSAWLLDVVEVASARVRNAKKFTSAARGSVKEA